MITPKSTLKAGLLIGMLSSLTLSMAATPPTAPPTKKDDLTRYCPPVNKIYRDAQNHWTSVGGQFRDFDTSLADTVDQFLGAQWQGTNLGYITCVYKPHNPNVFLVTLFFNQLTYQPSTQRTLWIKDKKGSWLNCNAIDPIDCPFTIRSQPKQQNVYQEAEHLKEESNPNDDPSF